MNKKLKIALNQSFTPPPTQYREKFINSIPYPKATFFQVFVSQVAFIRKRIWFLFMFSVCFAIFYTQFIIVPENIIVGVSAILPFLSLCIITEIYKSTTYNMEEIELVCKYSLPKIILMRMGILGTVSSIILVLFIIIVEKSGFGTLRNTIYISVPYLLSSYLSLLTVSKFHSKETIYICTVISGAVSIFIITVNINHQFIYSVDFIFIWITLFAVFIVLLFYRTIRFIKSQEELQWNLL